MKPISLAFKPLDPRDISGTRSDWDKATDALGDAATSRVISTGQNIGNSLRQAGQGILSAGQGYYDEQYGKMNDTRNSILGAPMQAVRGLTGMLSPTPLIQDTVPSAPVSDPTVTAHAADTLMNRGIDSPPRPSAHANLMANAGTMFGEGVGQSSSNPLTLEHQRQMGMETQKLDQWGKPLNEADTQRAGTLWGAQGASPAPIIPQQSPSTPANTGLPRMIANERRGGGIGVSPQGQGDFSQG